MALVCSLNPCRLCDGCMECQGPQDDPEEVRKLRDRLKAQVAAERQAALDARENTGPEISGSASTK